MELEDELLVLQLQTLSNVWTFTVDFFDEVDERNDRRRQISRIDIDNWRRMGDPTFHDHFQMTHVVFERFVVVVGRHLVAKNRMHFVRTPLDVALMMALWILSTPDSFRSTGTTFGVSRGVVFFSYVYIIEALRELSAVYVRWPGPVERDIIKTSFEEKYDYPGAVGCIDCCQIKIYSPMVQAHRYVNRHHDHALIVQAVCDHNLLFRDVYVGEPGGVGDARTFQRSPLSRNLFCRGGYLSDDQHILGDGAYPLSEQILTPFLNDGHLTNRQLAHNYKLSRTRASIERAFARWRGKLRRLKHLPCYSLHYAVDHIMSIVVVHNFIILEGKLPGLHGDEVHPFHLQNAP